MAELTLGVGMSHSSLIATEDPTIWLAHEAIDRDHPYLRDKAGHPVTLAELERANGHRYKAQASLEHIAEQVQHTHKAIPVFTCAVGAGDGPA